MQDEIKDRDNVPLSVVYEIKRTIPIQMVRVIKTGEDVNFKCYRAHHDEIVKETLRNYFKYTKVSPIFYICW